ncbi:hypothetical protein [Marisediminicola senii]|uniref:hypothetical protein n=1 Tax=Marisediminicola senii TaxID=2711233 RepID=UPI0019128F96|nr:hypothetical protein [Marisediminicola senii]
MTGSRSRVAAFGVGLTLCGSLLLTGCTTSGTKQLTAAPTAPATADPEPAVASTPAPTPTPEPTPVAEPAPAPTPQSAPIVTITLDDLSYGDPGAITTVPFTQGNDLVVAIQSLTGSAPSVSDIEDPWGNGDIWGTRYQWDGINVNVLDGNATLRISTATLGDSVILTAQGLAVGSTRADAVAAGAWDDYDENDDQIADYLGIGSREIAGTESLGNPGAVGVEYLMLEMNGDVVSAIHAPANDFSDI